MADDRPRITIEFEDVEHLRREFESNLKNGGTFAAGATGVPERAACEVVLVHPETKKQLTLRAEAVWVKPDEPGQGIGVQFQEFEARLVEQLESFVAEAPAVEPGHKDESIIDRLRGISAAEQYKIARQGTLPERQALERIYGKTVWEPLLGNRRLTPPEVARIARMGSLPKPLMEQIVGNSAWLSQSVVRRALLSNPRLTGQLIERVLRLLPRPELNLVPKQNAYSQAVRIAARRMIARG